MPLKVSNKIIDTFAKTLSIIGHPLLVIPVFAIIALFKYENTANATTLSALIVGGLIVPVVAKMYLGYRKGTYSNFDVSDQTERKTWYSLPIILLTIFTLYLFFTEQERNLRMAISLSLVLLISSKLINNYIKISLHASFGAYIAMLAFQLLGILYGWMFLLFALLVACARVALARHTVLEVVLGLALGLILGGFYLLA
jgi:membrane-associated phospholipid phosphatase